MFSSPLYRKLFVLALLTGLLLLPQSLIEDLVKERHERYDATASQILREWGSGLTLRGPLLRVPVRRHPVGKSDWSLEAPRYLVAQEVQATARVDVERRSRGIFAAQVYQGMLTLTGTLEIPAKLTTPGTLTGPASEESLIWDEASLLMFYSSRDGVNGVGTVMLPDHGGRKLPMSLAAGPDINVIYAGATLGLSAAPQAGERLRFVIEVPFKGAGRLELAPLALTATTVITSNWPSPSFGGSVLPKTRAVNAAGFRAEFITTASAADFEPTGGAPGELLRSLAGDPRQVQIDLLSDVSHYLQVTRAVKYDLLFIVLTFATFFLFETFGGLKLHPIQYLSVGAALIVFYLLLLSLSEQVAFPVAYAVAATAVVLLVSLYARSILGQARRSLVIGGGLAGLYGFMYTLLQLEQQALIVGSIGLFAALAAFMYATRKVDWYGFGAAKA